MNNPFKYVPSAECEKAFLRLVEKLDLLKQSNAEADINFCRELESGKMLGVLIAADDEGKHHTLYAFSGQLGSSGFHFPGFVEPVFDYLQPGGYFKTKETDISIQNKEINKFEIEEISRLRKALQEAQNAADIEIYDYKLRCRHSKSERDARRKNSDIGEAELTAMIRQSQFEKAQLRRLKMAMSGTLEPYKSAFAEAESHLNSLKAKRKKDSEDLQQWLFRNFKLLNAKGESLTLSEIFGSTPFGIPPSGAGECCAPKLLQAAYTRGWLPLDIAEYWYGRSKSGEVRIHGRHYPACRGKCLPVLDWMLQGLEINPPMSEVRDSFLTAAEDYKPEIIFENEWFCVVNKPSGMLSVPGKGMVESLEEWLIGKYGSEKCVRLAHRLDQDTSGLVVAAFGIENLKILQSLFARRLVKKTYIAMLEGDWKSRNLPTRGSINIPISPDYLDRPRQRVDMEAGKQALTEYEFTRFSEGRSRVEFHPLTGRTHQLRVHSASEYGLGMPIAGDRLYGISHSAGRLLLHAHKVEFIFPGNDHLYIFQSPCPF